MQWKSLSDEYKALIKRAHAAQGSHSSRVRLTMTALRARPTAGPAGKSTPVALGAAPRVIFVERNQNNRTEEGERKDAILTDIGCRP